MVMVDAERRYVEVNRPARLAFWLDVDELGTLALDDLAPKHVLADMEWAWKRLLATGSVAGRSQVSGSDKSRVDVVYWGLAHVLPKLHLIAFAPADWLDPGPGATEGGPDVSASLTPREIEVLALAADGLSGPGLARELELKSTTVKTHFRNIYEKLEVQNRAAAVAKAMRHGVID
jgi:DNA-binding CsgD family transcriptional regulator